ncbi:cadherin-related family member 1-like [Argopecten irradians]|uniref:cadherin-related family member 1-like n=1 Tax=Argopecten irradians TaxID=31199 RepID=UPI003714758C
MERIARTLVFLFALFTIDPVQTQKLPPRFPSNLYGFIPENQPNGSLITSFNVTDPNNDVITLGIYDDFTRSCVYLTTTNSRAGFVTGNVYLSNPDNFDYDRGQRDVRLAFTASDGANTVTGFIHVYVSDVHDNAPEFRRPAYIYEILENTTFPSTHNASITATDADDGVNKVFVYSLHAAGQSAGLYQGVFSIDPNNGSLTLNEALDYETLNFYQYTITAVDKGTPAMTGSAEITIKVTDVQDTPPYFQGLPYLMTIKENHQWVGRNLLAQDGDRGNPRQIQYSLNDSECSRLFTLDTTTGQLLLKDVLDRDAGTILKYQGVCRLQIQASEVTHPGEPTVNSTASTTVTVTVEDIDDNVPTFTLSHYNAYVDEEVSNIPLTIDGSIGIDVYDLDQGENSEFSLAVNYANGTKCTGIESTPSHIIGKATVLLRLVNGFKFDYETEDIVELHVVSTGKVNNSMSTTSSVTVYINNTNDDVNEIAATSEYPYPRTSDGTRTFKPISKATTHDNSGNR